MKICGITSPEDALVAEDAGADAIGVVLFSRSPRSVSLERAMEIFAAVGPGVMKVGVSHTTNEDELDKITAILKPDAIQIFHPALHPRNYTGKVIRAIGPGDTIPADADYLIADASHGKGKLFDEDFARNLVKTSPVPVLLAGGLNPGNVEEAIRKVRPYAVDVATGVEDSPGKKNPGKVREFINKAKGEKYE